MSGKEIVHFANLLYKICFKVKLVIKSKSIDPTGNSRATLYERAFVARAMQVQMTGWGWGWGNVLLD